jgi:ATP-binding cassette subfamily B protein
MDCGPSCLKIIARYFGKTVSLKSLRDNCFVTREGVSLFDIARSAEELGFRTLSVKADLNDLVTKLPLPLIAHWKQEHFIVVYKVTGNKIYVSDPAVGLSEYSHQDFTNSWLTEFNWGGILVLEPTPEFFEIASSETSSSITYYFRYLKPYKKYLLQLLAGMVVTILIGLITPFISQSMVDYGIGAGNVKFVHTMLISGVVLAFSSMISGFIQNRMALYVSERVNLGLVSDFLRKILKLNFEFYERKTVSDIMTRIADFNRIQTFLMRTTLGLLINCLLIIVYGALMLYYEQRIFLVFSISTILYISWIFLFADYRKKMDSLMFEAKNRYSTILLEIFENINEIKVNNLANSRRWKWELSRANIYDLTIRSLSVGELETLGSTFILRMNSVIITYISALNVIDGRMTLGMMMATQYILGQLSAPIGSLIQYFQSIQFAKLSIRRINEVVQEELPEDQFGLSCLPSNRTIYLHDVGFQYNPNLEHILSGITLSIPEGKTTAIVGSSGGGKTTLVKLLLGFYKPSSGSIFVGDVPLERISVNFWRANCGTVLQDGKLFGETLLYNITLADNESSIDYERLTQALDIANLKVFVESRPLKLYTTLGPTGVGLSQGQKQRILLARAIYRNPTYLFLDEATNSLDSTNEASIARKLASFMKGKTSVIIAHRLNTIKNADSIIVLDKGRVVEQGTHHELMDRNSHYFKLVENQIF